MLNVNTILRLQTAVHVLQTPQTLNQQSRQDEQHHRDRQLADHEHAAHADCAARLRSCRVRLPSAIRPTRSSTSETRARVQRSGRSSTETPNVNPSTRQSIPTWTARGMSSLPSATSRSDHQTASNNPTAPPNSDNNTLSVSNCRITRIRLAPMRGANRHLFVTAGGARKQQVRDVRARDQQHARDRTEKNQQRRTNVANQRGERGFETQTLARVFVRDIVAPDAQRSRSVRSAPVPGHAWFQTADDAQEVRAALACDRVLPDASPAIVVHSSTGSF